MSGARFRHLGGQVVGKHGAIPLVEAESLLASLQARAETLARAIAEARRWRRAAGWVRPEDADRPAKSRADWKMV